MLDKKGQPVLESAVMTEDQARRLRERALLVLKVRSVNVTMGFQHNDLGSVQCLQGPKGKWQYPRPRAIPRFAQHTV
jgi:hypothetical protein